jgi:hypothetical protein
MKKIGRRRALVGIVALAGLAAAAPRTALAQQISLSGSFFRIVSGDTTPAPGIQVYVMYLPQASDSTWIGPVLTDSSGRFFFYNLHSGPVLLRAFGSANTVVWQEQYNVPSTLQPIVLK